MNAVAGLIINLSKRARQRRAEIFRRSFSINSKMKLLDLGSEDGSNIASVLDGTDYKPENVFIADIETDKLEYGKNSYGFTPVHLKESGGIPYPDKFFDLVYCSSVIEHVTVPKELVWNREIQFEQIAQRNQQLFASEIIRAGKEYFVQTPAKTFPIESHSWLPLINFLPRSMLISSLQLSNSFWIKQTIPDFRLLDQSQMTELFPEAKIITERKFGLVKSIIAVKTVM